MYDIYYVLILFQVITQDGQTIPVEINGYADEEVNIAFICFAL